MQQCFQLPSVPKIYFRWWEMKTVPQYNATMFSVTICTKDLFSMAKMKTVPQYNATMFSATICTWFNGEIKTDRLKQPSLTVR